MGVDSIIYVEGSATDEELAAAETYLREHSEYLLWCPLDHGYGLLVRMDDCGPRITFLTGIRYYAPGYERGSWPHIHAAIRAMQGAFPYRKVFYRGDSREYGTECTPELLDALWRYWQGLKGKDCSATIAKAIACLTGER